MLTIYYSNQANFFKEFLVNVIANHPLSDPMTPEIMLVENRIIEKWINIELANSFGIASNISFMNITDFFQKISSTILSQDIITNISIIRSMMYWKFMEILPQVCSISNCDIIKKYLSSDFDQRKCGQFATQLVSLFSKYLMYRSDWLYQWQSNQIVSDLTDINQSWQSEIWRIFVKKIKSENPKLFNSIYGIENCIQHLKDFKKISFLLPNRIFICGITFIPCIYWRILYSLSYYFNIYVWVMIPYHYENFHVIKQKLVFLLKNKKRNQLKDNSSIVNNITSNNILLNSWGLIGKKTLYLLSKLENITEIKNFSVPKTNSLLHVVQRSLLESKNYCKDSNYSGIYKFFYNNPRHMLLPNDKSITFHICYSVQREVEILHNNLLLMIQDNPSLLKSGIVVMVPDINQYIGSIQTVFDNIYGRDLPFVISDNLNKNMHPIIESFLKILNLSSSRSTLEEILSFLLMPLISARFNLDQEEILLLRKWIIESGIRWGLDNFTMDYFSLPVTHQNTWYFGLTRMLLGYVMGNDCGSWKDIVPYYDNINEDFSNIIGHLGEFLFTLSKWRDKLNNFYTLEKWILYMKKILNDFFCFSNLNDEENKALFILNTCWKDILELGIKSGYKDVIGVKVLLDLLYDRLKKKINYQFFPNTINFCNISSTCCISFKLVCFLGMNNSFFPKKNFFLDFDLIAKNPRISDNSNIRDKNCYSFLLAFLLAQEKIYISYIDCSIYENVKDSPSVLIDELYEYIAQNFYLSGDKNDLDININLHRIQKNLCTWYSATPFAIENFIVTDSNRCSFSEEWLSAAYSNIYSNKSISFKFIDNLPNYFVDTILFNDLYNFYCHPVKTWFQKRLGVFFNEKELNNVNDEPFIWNYLDRFKWNKILLNDLIYSNDIDSSFYYNIIRGSGCLPYGSFGKFYWKKQFHDIKLLADQIKLYSFSDKYNIDINLVINKINLVGQLCSVQNNGLFRWKPSYLTMKDILLFWLEHLVYCAIGESGDSHLFGINSITWNFPNFSIYQAKELLSLFISGYCSGMNMPLLLLYKSGGEWINQVFDWNTRTISLNSFNHKKAYKKLVQAWSGTKYSFIQECSDPYLNKLIPLLLDEKSAQIIINTAKIYFFDFMKYRIF